MKDNPLRDDWFELYVDGTNRCAKKAIDILQIDNDDNEDPVEDICLHVEFIKLSNSCPNSCRDVSVVPDSNSRLSVNTASAGKLDPN